VLRLLSSSSDRIRPTARDSDFHCSPAPAPLPLPRAPNCENSLRGSGLDRTNPAEN